jgi:hypothetical protein
MYIVFVEMAKMERRSIKNRKRAKIDRPEDFCALIPLLKQGVGWHSLLLYKNRSAINGSLVASI